MTRVASFGLSVLALLASSGRGQAQPVHYELDAEHLTIAFLVEHIGYAKLLGQFLTASGDYTFDATTGTLSRARVVVETGSVDTNHEARDGHLKSRDFFDSGAHTTMIFTATSAQRTSERTYVVMGELQLLGTSRPLVLEATLNKTAPYPIGARAEVMGVSLRGKLKRSEFGMTYGVADGLVGDDVELLLELEARRVSTAEQGR